MAHRLLKSGRNNHPGGALQLRLRQYSERPSGPSPHLHLSLIKKASKITVRVQSTDWLRSPQESHLFVKVELILPLVWARL
jgi:hypothetical protein